MEDKTNYLQSIQPKDPKYGIALRALARLGSLEWIESIKNTDQYTSAIKQREEKYLLELQEFYAAVV